MELLITNCTDSLRWYASKIGQTVPFLCDVGNEYKSREPAGYVNFVQYSDAVIVDANGTVVCDKRDIANHSDSKDKFEILDGK